MLAAVATLALSCISYREAHPLPDLTFGAGWGVNIHFTKPARGEIEKIRDAGFKWVRMDFAWSDIEREKGEYDFSAYDELFKALDRNRIRPLFILDYGNDLYEKDSPSTPEAREAFCDFVEASVTHFLGRGAVWEMWNEPNIAFWKPRPNVRDYILLARAVGERIREVAPDEWYVGPATSTVDRVFPDACLKARLLTYWDAVTVHPYRNENPETVIRDYDWLRQTIARFAPSDKSVPMWSGEWGYSERYPNLNPERQAQYLVRQYLTNLAARVPVSIWYDWKDDGPDQEEVEHHFGIVFRDLKPKPAYRAARDISRELGGWTFARRIEMDTPEPWVLEFTKGSRRKYVGWTTGSPGPFAVPDDSVRPMNLTVTPKIVKPFERK